MPSQDIQVYSFLLAFIPNLIIIIANEQPGDIVKVKCNEFVPADLIVMQTGLPEGSCYVNTANLDGETNLKLRKGTSQTLPLDLSAFRGTLEVEPPNAQMYELAGKLTIAPGLLKRTVVTLRNPDL